MLTYREMVDSLLMVEDFPQADWASLHEEIEQALHETNSSYPWSDPNEPLPNEVPGGSAVYHALFHTAEETGKYIAAWKYLSKALDMDKEGRRLKSDIYSDNNKELMNEISPGFSLSDEFVKHRVTGVYDTSPIFVFGYPLAAVDIVSRMLSNNEDIYGMPMGTRELDRITKRRTTLAMARNVLREWIGQIRAAAQVAVSRAGNNGGSLSLSAELSASMKNVGEALLQYFDQLTKAFGGSEKKHFVVQMGVATELVGLVHSLFPDALIVSVVSDPLEAMYMTCVEKTDLSMADAYMHVPYVLAKRLALSVQLMAYFESVLPPNRVKSILLSDFLRDPRSALTDAVLSPLELAWQQGMDTGNGAGPLLHRLRRVIGRAREYVITGDISVYQSEFHYFLVHTVIKQGWTMEFPFPTRIDWQLGPQVTWRHDGCLPEAPRMPSRRDDLGRLLDDLNLSVGAELGVQEGIFANITLSNWTKCKKYYLIDVWRQLDSLYMDQANVGDDIQERFFRSTRARLQQYAHRTDLIYLRNFTSVAVDHIEDESLDFVYIDARHDYCSVAEDMALYWPKLRQGGILAGHDYVLSSQLYEFHDGPFIDRYDICPDGRLRARSVKGAVDDFSSKYGLQVAFTYQDPPPFLTWIIRKPCGKNSDYNYSDHNKQLNEL